MVIVSFSKYANRVQTNTFMKLLLYLLVFLSLALPMSSQTQGDLTVEVNTSETGGSYAPSHILAIWIEDNQGNFVKTLLAYGSKRKTHLNTWQLSTKTAGSEYNAVDAITGATKSSHSRRTCTWNGNSFQGSIVSDGTYKLYMELTDKNSTGVYTSFNFTKGQSPVQLNPSNMSSFSNVSISWMPASSVIAVSKSLETLIYPNPSAGIFFLKGVPNTHLQVWDLNGVLIMETQDAKIDLSFHPSGLYFITNKSGESISFARIVKL